MADFLEDVGVGYYRSLDPPKNFVVKVKLRRVTAASFLPAFRIGSQQSVNVQEGAEVGGEALEMPEIRREQGKQGSDSEECVFFWQQKMFSEREMELYEDANNCFGPLEQKYHTEILKLRKKGGRPNKRLFSYADSDSYVNLDEEARSLTTSPVEVPNLLAKNMSSVRRRNVGSKLDRRNHPGGFASRANPVVIHESESSKISAHVINIPYKTMHIMADLAPDDKKIRDQEDEYVLFSVKIDANGQMFVKPDFSGDQQPPYRIETCNELREVYEYTVEHCSPDMTSEQREQEFKSFNELYNRHALYLTSQVGSGFDPMPEPGVLRINIFGEIVSAKGFEYDGLHVHFFLDLPQKWRPSEDPVLSGVTQTCITKLEGKDNVAHFSYPFDFSLVYEEDQDSEDFIHWPTLFLEVLSLDSWERFRTEGYAYLTVPSKPGTSTYEVDTWRPISNRRTPEMRRFFIGGSPELEDPTYPQRPAMADEKVLSKYFFRTAASGSVTVKFNVVQQCQAFMYSKKQTHRARTLLDRLGGLGAIDSLTQVMDAFQRAKKRMLAAREGLPDVK